MCMNLYRNIDREKVQFDFVKHSDAAGAFEEEILALGGRIFTAPRYKLYNKRQYVSWWRSFLRAHPEYRIIHGHFFTISPVYFQVAHEFGLHTIGHIHASSTGTSLKERIKLHNLMKIEKTSDSCFACSKTAGKWIYKNKPFIVLNNAVDTEKFALDTTKRIVMREELGLAPDDVMVCVVANIHSVKNPIGTIDVFKAIREKMPTARLFWVGDGGMRTELQEKITAEGLSDCVTLLGVRGNVADILQAADVFMLCSFSEGLPVVTIEAQASGLPCLLSSAITTEADITGLCCFLPIDQSEVWADAMSELINTPRTDTSEQIKAAGYDIKTTSAWLTDFYLKAAKLT